MATITSERLASLRAQMEAHNVDVLYVSSPHACLFFVFSPFFFIIIISLLALLLLRTLIK